MAKSGLYTGVDIGTNTIKVLVAEYVSGENEYNRCRKCKTDGLKNGIIVDIEKVAQALRKAVNAAEERAGITIDRINVSIPANSLEMEPCQGMVPIVSDTKEITDNDVIQVVQNALSVGLFLKEKLLLLKRKSLQLMDLQVFQTLVECLVYVLRFVGLFTLDLKLLFIMFCKVFERAGLLVDNIVIAPLAGTIRTYRR